MRTVRAEGMSVGQCAFCNADVELLESAESPICARCSTEHHARRTCLVSGQEIRFALIQDLVDATVREKAAADEFDTVISQFPSGLPHPDGSQLIRNASCKLIAARKDKARAHSRLNDFLDRGINRPESSNSRVC
jgi:hypothetical protein